jgi:hypothetical protein
MAVRVLDGVSTITRRVWMPIAVFADRLARTLSAATTVRDDDEDRRGRQKLTRVARVNGFWSCTDHFWCKVPHRWHQSFNIPNPLLS